MGELHNLNNLLDAIQLPEPGQSLQERGNRIANAQRWVKLANDRLRVELEDHVHGRSSTGSAVGDRARFGMLQELRSDLVEVERKLAVIAADIAKEMERSGVA